uniref:Pumilio homolog 23-like n=1 Tax=Nicotiana tabacum TaxID=4097 RepID=A0A1S4CX48_TOBAC|nr:PREDICTED: pumilio homolog 23-like [Nicotiana tabacum]
MLNAANEDISKLQTNQYSSLVLQELIQIYVTSITSLEEHHVLAASKDPSGSRVIESFRNSNISAKQKWKLVAKLRGHFGELSVHPFGSFTVEKCFTASNLSLRETILSEMLPLQSELSKTKQGPYLLRKLDIDG